MHTYIVAYMYIYDMYYVNNMYTYCIHIINKERKFHMWNDWGWH